MPNVIYQTVIISINIKVNQITHINSITLIIHYSSREYFVFTCSIIKFRMINKAKTVSFLFLH